MSENKNQIKAYEPLKEDKKSVSFVWIIPLIILLILGWIAYESYMQRGTNISIVLKSAEGLKENVTPLEYKGLQLGKVTKITMHEDMKNVKVNILINNEASKYVAVDGSRFWIKKPTVSLTKVSGLNTLISGYKIELSPKFKTQKEFDNAKTKTLFQGLESQPEDELADNGYSVSILADSNDEIVEVGTPIFYNQFQIGEIISKNLNSDKVFLEAYIYDEYVYLINNSSNFVLNKALKVSYGAGGLNLELGSIYSAIVGGITVTTPKKNDYKKPKGDYYELYSDKDELKDVIDIDIRFSTADGIGENTPIIYRGVNIGKITDILLNSSFITAKAYIDSKYKYLLTKNSEFYVAKVDIGLDGVKNLGTVVKGNYVTLDHVEGEFSTKFYSKDYDETQSFKKDLKLTLFSDNLNSINKKSKIYYKNIEIGKVVDYGLSKDLKKVEIKILIDKKYEKLVTNNSMFYDMSSKLVEIKNMNLDINYSGIDVLLNGGIGLVSDVSKDKLNDKNFLLYSSYKDVEELKRIKNEGFILESYFDNDFVLKKNMSIVYKNQEIGYVKDINFSDKKSKVKLFIYNNYKKFINAQSRFYKEGVINFKAGLNGIIFEVDNFTSLIEGSIHLDNSATKYQDSYKIYGSLDLMNSASNTITILFDDVEGLKEEFSYLTYKGANIGKVSSIKLNKEQKVEVKATIFDNYNSFAKEGTIFYLKKPIITLQEVSNIGSTVMPVQIGILKSEKEKFQNTFKGYDSMPSLEKSQLGTVFKVEDSTASSVNVNAPIYYKNVEIGKINKIDLSSDGSKVIIDCLIFDRYTKFIRKNSQFYDISGFEMKFSVFSGSKVESNTFTSLIKGGLVVVTPYEYMQIATPKERFKLIKELREDWKEISPSIK